MSQRFPGYFDGVLACSPGFKLPKAALFGEVWDTQAYAEVAKSMGVYDRFGQPLLSKTFTDEDLDLAVQAILTVCDRLDELEDGIIDNFPACTAELLAPKLAAITCKGPNEHLSRRRPGGRTPKGIRRREKFQRRDALCRLGLGSRHRRPSGGHVQPRLALLEMGPYDAPLNIGLNATLGAGAVSAVFTTPPTAVPPSGAGPMAYLLGIDFDRDAAKLYGESGVYTKSAWDFMMAEFHRSLGL